MRSFVLASLAGLAVAAPAAMPQDSFDWDIIDAAVEPSPTGAPMGVVSSTSSLDITAINAAATSAASSAYSEALANPRDGTCASQPSGSGPKTTPDTAAAFSANTIYNSTALAAGTPPGYSVAFGPNQGATSASVYLGYYTLTSYDPYKCQEYCDQATNCYAFNIYYERDPSKDPNAVNCPNPASTVNIKCSLWGSQIDATTATNNGQWRDNFQVVIAGSMGFNKLADPPACASFNAPTELAGAIQAPSGYMGSRYYPGAYDPSQCASACIATNQYSHKHPRSDGTYDPCNFFNSYVLSKNGAPQGTYCSMYTSTWGKSLSTNYGQYRGSDRYTVGQSYGWTLTTQDSGNVAAL
ncbi:uncharacterized protein M437DRAFT_57857 [Aureobasidium melanogenum CBS 110374]|uniref:Apple domain-containing protein n=1 Tax=Aureobasidium melanogenum (strain CBS 110374) TaxID=1043003 RepID=A0A074W9F9_AURM1|nr:uncharacterized protein M437DRAFT_57857 [Aureobasidium melanogenum CBS 110374]KEQ59146.1 hypothetical protein M437DRAFT_57857 [Aureobasidium melanogenum CBS 110374]